ncbi:MAG: branched-chain amino acid ABC transporter permease, partial [Chloroflexota bacterium]
MDYFISLTITGLVMGIIFALMALGLTLIFSILNVINFAHGEFYMLGGYAIFLILEAFSGVPPLLVVPIAGILVAILGVVFEILFLRPMHDEKIERPAEYAVLVTFGLSFFLLNLALAVWGPYPHSPPSFIEGSVHLGPIFVSADRLVASAGSLLLLGLLLLVINKTWLG